MRSYSVAAGTRGRDGHKRTISSAQLNDASTLYQLDDDRNDRENQ